MKNPRGKSPTQSEPTTPSSVSGSTEMLLRLLSAETVGIYIAVEGRLRYIGATGQHAEAMDALPELYVEGELSNLREPTISRVKADELRELGSESGHVLDIPILRDAELLGVARCARAKAFAPADIALVEPSLPWLALLLEAFCSESRISAALEDMTSCSDESTLASNILLHACQLVHADIERSGVYLRSTSVGVSTFTLRSLTHKMERSGGTPEKFAGKKTYGPGLGAGPTAYVLRSGTTLWSNDIESSLKANKVWLDLGMNEGSAARQTRAFIGVPIRVRNETEGALILKAPVRRAWSAFEVRLVERLVGCFSTLLDRLRVRDGLLYGLFTASSRPIVAVNPRGKVTEVNSAAAQIVAKNVEGLQDKDVHQAFYGDERLLAWHINDRLRSCSGQALRNHYTYVTRAMGESTLALPVPVRMEAIEVSQTHGSIGIIESLLPQTLPTRVRSFGDRTMLSFTADPRLCAILDEADDSRDRDVLLIGERGSGKSFLARHLNSDVQAAFVHVRCGAALAPERFVEELFGKRSEKNGESMLSKARKGVLFLDELGRVPLAIQRLLLDYIEEGSLPNDGSSRRARLVAATRATRADLDDESRFLPELLKRLDAGNAFELSPFRERRADILLAATAYLRYQAPSVHKRRPTAFDSHAVEVLWHYRWPGGLRELFSLLEAACARWQQANDGCDPKKLHRRLIGVDHFWRHLVEDALRTPYSSNSVAALDTNVEAKLAHRAEAVRGTRHSRAGSDVGTEEQLRRFLLENPHFQALRRLRETGAVAAAFLREHASSKLDRKGRTIGNTLSRIDPLEAPDRERQGPNGGRSNVVRPAQR